MAAHEDMQARLGAVADDARIPFPGSGQQKKFEAAFAKAMSVTPVHSRR